jgi:hypothetical protein
MGKPASRISATTWRTCSAEAWEQRLCHQPNDQAGGTGARPVRAV